MAGLCFVLTSCEPPQSDAGSKQFTGPITLSKHAQCRMDCRRIREEEIREILATGKENIRKSDPHGKPCPTKALEGWSSDQQHIRVIAAQCDQMIKIVTVIDLETDWECSCR